jgi:Armadillo/beta-catenin-like repeat
MLKRRNKWVQKNACWGLAFLAEGAEEWVDELLLCKPLLPKLVELLGHPKASIIAAALRTIGQVLMGDESRVKLVIDCGALPMLKVLLQHRLKSIRKDACWCISNITVDSSQHIQAVIDAEIIPIIVDILKQTDGDFEIRKECAWVCCNVSCGGSAEQISMLAELGVSSPLFDLLDTSKDKKLVTIVLEGLESILYEDTEYSDTITEEQIEKLRKLAQSDDATTREIANCLLDEFF